MTKEKLLLMDGHSLAFRAFYAMHSQLHRMKNRNGLHTNALYGLHNMIEAELKKEQPTHVMLAFDAGSTTFRHEHYEEYKGGRDSMPSELSEQMPYLEELLSGFGIKYYMLDQYEADDIIGTLAKEADERGMPTVILTGDRDLTQLVSDHVRVDFTRKGVSDVAEYTPEYLMEEMGITPEQVVELKGLMGDASDNIPGVKGIGEKRGKTLLEDWGTIENLYENIDSLKKSKMKENLIEQKDIAFLSKQLATIKTDTPITVKIDDLKYEGYHTEKLVEFYKEMDFNSHLQKLDTSGIEEVEQAEVEYQVVTEITAEMFSTQQALYVEQLEENYHTADIAAVAWGNKEGVYIADIETVGASDEFKNWASDESIEKYVFDAKQTYVSLFRYDIEVKNMVFDVLLASYLLTARDHKNSVSDAAFAHQYNGVQSDESVYGKGKKIAVPEDESLMHQHLASKIKAVIELSAQLEVELAENNQVDLLKAMELPLSLVLAKMEIRGITVDADNLNEMHKEFAAILDKIEQDIFEKSGEEFNINSPKQLGVILFEKMGYPVIKKTKTGYSTAVDVLEKLRDQAPIVEDILKYRTISKIQSTYVEGLLNVIDETSRVHTRYLQTVARTGRLSSVDPNLQNIPVRTEEGRKIRKAFTANKDGWYIFASDYSQIELRLMAHISKDEHLTNAFNNQEDIHTATAVRIFDLESADQVEPNMRRDAKVINFGILYGMSDYGLSENLGISRAEAKKYIETYFERYPGVSQYIEDIIREARENGYVETLFHRRRYLDDINARNFNQRSFAERTAMNTPIQGSAADIIKMAMIEMEDRLEKEGMQSRMLLQVHDELIFEVPEDELEKMQELVPEVMEQIVDLDVPLRVESSYGKTWYAADEA